MNVKIYEEPKEEIFLLTLVQCMGAVKLCQVNAAGIIINSLLYIDAAGILFHKMPDDFKGISLDENDYLRTKLIPTNDFSML